MRSTNALNDISRKAKAYNATPKKMIAAGISDHHCQFGTRGLRGLVSTFQ